MKYELKPLRVLGWNQRVLTMDDFYSFAEANQITLIEGKLDVLGYYKEWHGQSIIGLATNAPEMARLHGAWHESGHYVFRTPGCYGLHAKTEFEADIVADCALIPFCLLYQYTLEQLMSDFDYPRWLVERRRALFDRLNI